MHRGGRMLRIHANAGGSSGTNKHRNRNRNSRILVRHMRCRCSGGQLWHGPNRRAHDMYDSGAAGLGKGHEPAAAMACAICSRVLEWNWGIWGLFLWKVLHVQAEQPCSVVRKWMQQPSEFREAPEKMGRDETRRH